MQFETRRISIDGQIDGLDRVIELCKSILGWFDEPGDADIRDDTEREMLVLIAARESLKRLKTRGEGTTSIDVPVVQDDRDKWLANTETMRILDELDPEFRPHGTASDSLEEALRRIARRRRGTNVI